MGAGEAADTFSKLVLGAGEAGDTLGRVFFGLGERATHLVKKLGRAKRATHVVSKKACIFMLALSFGNWPATLGGPHRCS